MQLIAAIFPKVAAVLTSIAHIFPAVAAIFEPVAPILDRRESGPGVADRQMRQQSRA